MSTPEWDIFKRIDDLEGITHELIEKIDKTTLVEPTIQSLAKKLQETSNLALITCILWFIEVATSKPNRARFEKDIAMELLKQASIGEENLKIIEAGMLRICEKVEQ